MTDTLRVDTLREEGYLVDTYMQRVTPNPFASTPAPAPTPAPAAHHAAPAPAVEPPAQPPKTAAELLGDSHDPQLLLAAHANAYANMYDNGDS